MTFEFKQPPYSKDALEPVISAKTLEFHFEKHHRGYLSKLESGVEGKEQADMSLEEIIVDKSAPESMVNNAAQVWNHSFYWESMRPPEGPAPSDRLAARLSDAFGSVDQFKQEFAAAAKGQFGSGWAWLVANDSGELQIISTTDAENPLQSDLAPLLTIDVWEHAYYLDYQNERARYVEGFLDHLINWPFIEQNLQRVSGY